MNIVLPVSTEQQITVYARDHSSNDYIITIIDEETNVSLTNDFTDFDEVSFADFDDVTFTDSYITTLDGKMELNFSYDFQEGRFYMIEVEAEKLIYRGKLYCTSQTGQYDVSTYTKPTENKNTFIVKK